MIALQREILGEKKANRRRPAFGLLIEGARGTLIRRASDPWEARLDGIMNMVVPETIDAMRGLTGSERNGERSIQQTDEALGIVSDFLSVREQTLVP